MNIKIPTAVITVCLYLITVNTVFSQGKTSDPNKREESFRQLVISLLHNHNDDEVGLLFDYVKKLGIPGQQDMCYVMSTVLLRPAQARILFDSLLTSESDDIIEDALDTLGYKYSFICKEKEISIVRNLLTSKNQKIRANAQYVLDMIEQTKTLDRDYFPDH